MHIRTGTLVLAFAVAGCSGETGGGDSTPDDDKGAAAPVEVGGKEVARGDKADCLDCDLNGPHAFAQLGLGQRFWKVGDSWQVAWLLRADTRVQMQEQAFLQQPKTDVGVTLLDFRVVELGSHTADGREHGTATIRITQGQASGSLSELLAGQQVQVDELTAQVDIVLDEFLRPVSFTEYSGPRGAFPNGRTFRTDPRQALRSLDTSFPYVVPNAYLGASRRSLPSLPETLAPVAAAARPDYETGTYFFFDLEGRGLESAEKVWWAPGDLWPFYVETPGAVGVLVGQSGRL